MASAVDYAAAIVGADTLAGKLVAPPDDLGFAEPGAVPAVRIDVPGRPRELALIAGQKTKVPPIAGMRDPGQRARILHALANHELQAIELFAWAVLAFPATPVPFRRGLVAILADEQRHLELYRARLAALGCAFGDHPVTGHFWTKLDHLGTPIEFVCAMGLTFEQANLDFCGDYAVAARAIGDAATADALDQVHADEIRHVHFGYVWMKKLAGDAAATSPWQTYLDHVRFPLGPARARGATVDRESRRRAGIDDAFIEQLCAISPTRPSGAPR